MVGVVLACRFGGALIALDGEDELADVGEWRGVGWSVRCGSGLLGVGGRRGKKEEGKEETARRGDDTWRLCHPRESNNKSNGFERRGREGVL